MLCLCFVSILYSWVGHLQIAGNRSAHGVLSINLSLVFIFVFVFEFVFVFVCICNCICVFEHKIMAENIGQMWRG